MNAENFGFKKLTCDNWLVPDSGGLTSDAWIQEILVFDLSEQVPIEVRKLFAVARGSIAYGYFFYPLLTLATEQLYRVVEAAIDHKCQEMGRHHKPGDKFAHKIEWLMKQSVIDDKKRWDAIRILRNNASHPKSQDIYSPGMVIDVLEKITECVNSLFVKAGPS